MNRADVFERISALSPAQQRSLMSALGHSTTERRQLVATWTGSADQSQLESLLFESLPPYMRPHRFLPVDELPRNLNGKLDYAAMEANFAQVGAESQTNQLSNPQKPQPQSQQSVQPDVEQASWLADIWCEVLGIATVTAQDNFFDLGGDSILGLNLVARARRAGYQMQASDLFEFPILQDQARAVMSAPSAPQPLIDPNHDGKLTPIESWFFELPLMQRDHWNMPIALAIHEHIVEDRLLMALRSVYEALPELGTTYTQRDGAWARGASTAQPLCVDRVSTDNVQQALLDAANLLQKTLSIEGGPLFRAVLIKPTHGESVLFLIAHHLVVDSISWNLLGGYIEQAYAELKPGSTPSSLVTSSTAAHWQAHLRQAIATGYFDAEIDFWRSMLPEPRTEVASISSRTEFVETLSASNTTALLAEANLAFGTTPEELLLCAVALSFDAEAEPCIHMEHHGRGHKIDNADLSTAIGWFTALFPLHLGRLIDDDMSTLLQTIKERRRCVPHNGLGYGALRYCHPDPAVCESLAAPNPPLLFNYLGTLSAQGVGDVFSQQLPPQPILRLARGDSTPQYALELNLFVADNALQIGCVAGDEAAGRKFVARFVDQLERVLEFCVAQTKTTYTPSDFPDAALSQDDLDSLLGELD